MRRASRRTKGGFTLVETMLAGALLALAVVSLFEGIGVCARIGHENAQYLQADAYAHDLAWKRYNESYANLKNAYDLSRGQPIVENISSNAAPALWLSSSVPRSRTTFSRLTGDTGAGLVITVDVEWGPSGRRRSLSSSGHVASIFKSSYEQGDK